MPQFGDGGTYPAEAATAQSLMRRCYIDIGATGAPTVVGDPGITVTRTGVGEYDFAFPAMPPTTIGIPIPEIGISKSAAVTVAGMVMTAWAPTSGTGHFRTFLATPGTAVDPANGDQLYIALTSGKSGAR